MMKNIQIIDGAINATYSIFQATESEYNIIFPDECDMELIEDLIARLGDDETNRVLAPLWERPILKRNAVGIHGTLFYDNDHRRNFRPQSKREVDWNEQTINQAQFDLFSRYR